MLNVAVGLIKEAVTLTLTPFPTHHQLACHPCMAPQVLVFNCDEEFDFKSMGRIFVGLVKCGAWGCFDEFNRLDEEVLSAVSQQIQTIQVGAAMLHVACMLRVVCLYENNGRKCNLRRIL